VEARPQSAPFFFRQGSRAAVREGFVGYLLVYQVLTWAAALRGQAQHVLGTRHRWA
jgi:hypothetical protein